MHYSDPITFTQVTDIARPDLPTEFSISQNYPSWFNPTTTLRYHLPVAGRVSVSVYDLLGREAAMLVNEEKEAGSHEVTFNAGGLAGGVYFCRLQAGSVVTTRRLVLLR
jgi:hypothetical protein